MLGILKDNFYLPLYAIAWVLSIAKFPKYFDSVLKYFPILIGYTLSTEVLGMVVRNDDNVSFIFEEGYSYYTLIIYNIYDLLFFMYFFYVYYKTIQNRKFKQFMKYGAGLYLITLVVNAILKSPLLNDMWVAYTFGAALLIIAICVYLYSLKGQSKAQVFSDLLFWVSIGALVFHIGYTPIMIVQNNSMNITEAEYHLMRNIHLPLIVFMYVCYCIGFLTMRRMPAMRGKM